MITVLDSEVNMYNTEYDVISTIENLKDLDVAH